MTNIFKSIKAVFGHPQNKGKSLIALSRIIFWKINQLFFKLPVIVNYSKATRLICYPDSSYSGLIFYCGFPEYEEIEFIRQIFPKNGVLIDVGANMGDLAALIGVESKESRVYAFEPSPLPFSRLVENIKLNNLESSVTPIQKVASDANGKIAFSQGNRSEIDHISHEINIDNDKRTTCESIKLDEFAKSTHLKKINLLKVDVEGAEYLVLSGASKLIQSQAIDIIVTEINVNSKFYRHTSDEVFDFLNKNHYSLYLISNELKLTKLNLSNLPLTPAYNIVGISLKAKNKYQNFMVS